MNRKQFYILSISVQPLKGSGLRLLECLWHGTLAGALQRLAITGVEAMFGSPADVCLIAANTIIEEDYQQIKKLHLYRSSGSPLAVVACDLNELKYPDFYHAQLVP